MTWSLIFDLDGTLVDTAPDLCAAVNYCLAQRGLSPQSEERLRSWVGQGARDLLVKAFFSLGQALSPDDLSQLHETFLRFYRQAVCVKSRPFPGTKPLLKKALDHGYTLGVCTNKNEEFAAKILETLGIAPFFKALVGGDTVGILKPDPAPYLETIARLGGSVDRTIFIGDSDTDRKTAHSAQSPFLAVLFGYGPLTRAMVPEDRCVHDMAGLWPVIEQIRWGTGKMPRAFEINTPKPKE